MGARIRRLGGAVLASVLTVGLTTGTASAAPGRDDLRLALAELAAASGGGVQIRVHDEDGDWTGSAGVRELDGGKVPVNGLFRAGSITKTFVSTVVLQLVDEGRLALDDAVDDHLPAYGLDPRITVRMLLQHTSGLFNYTGEPQPDGTVEPGIPLFGKEFERNRFRTYRPAELVAVSLAKPARFEPGASWSYSNTGYVLAGQLIERLTGTSYATQVRHRILTPLRLRDTVLPGTRTGIPGPHAHGYYTYHKETGLRELDVSRVNPTWASSAGELISTTRDLDRFITALLGGELLPTDLLAEMREALPLDPGYGYALGLENLDVGPECGGLYEGHTGGLHGYQSFMFSTPDGGTRFEISLTTGDADLDDPAVGERVSIALNNVLIAAICDTAPPAGRPMLVEQLATA